MKINSKWQLLTGGFLESATSCQSKIIFSRGKGQMTNSEHKRSYNQIKDWCVSSEGKLHCGLRTQTLEAWIARFKTCLYSFTTWDKLGKLCNFLCLTFPLCETGKTIVSSCRALWRITFVIRKHLRRMPGTKQLLNKYYSLLFLLVCSFLKEKTLFTFTSMSGAFLKCKNNNNNKNSKKINNLVKNGK